MDNSVIINDIIAFNKDEQIKTRIEFCKNNQSSLICSYVDKNNYEKWYNYYSQENNNNLFSKGINRLKSWDKLFQDEPILYFSKEIIPTNSEENILLQNIINKLKSLRNYDRIYYFFILAGLIIIFQIFGDANHRTAKYFYKNMTGKDITYQQEMRINDLLRRYEYYSIENKPIYKMDKIINELIEIITTVSGGKKNKRKLTQKKRLKQKKKLTQKRKFHKNKSKKNL
jgi:hypothetical protein